MFTTTIDARDMIRTLSTLEKKEFPFALAVALNDTAFQDVRPGWKDEMPRVFDRPTRLTLNAVLVKKARKKNPVAEIFLRNTAHKGTPPARYLIHEVEGGTRLHKPFENILIRAGIMSANEFAVPGTSYPLDNFGNIPGKVIRALLSDLQVSRSDDTSSFSTPASRRRRRRRKRKRGGIYFLSRGGQNVLPRGVYERIITGFGVSARTVLHFVSSVRYEERFDAYQIAQDLFDKNFPRRFRAAMKKAVRTSRKK